MKHDVDAKARLDSMRGACCNIEYDQDSAVENSVNGEPAVCFRLCGDPGELQGAFAFVWGRVFLLRTGAMRWFVADADVRFPTGLSSVNVLLGNECGNVPLHWPVELPRVLKTMVVELIKEMNPERLPPEIHR